MRVLAFLNDMKKKLEKIEEIKVVETPSTQPAKIKIASFSGSFPSEDFNRLKDKLNEVIDFINEPTCQK